jgi:hypothetical protein
MIDGVSVKRISIYVRGEVITRRGSRAFAERAAVAAATSLDAIDGQDLRAASG